MAVFWKYSMLCVKCKYLTVVLLMFFHRRCLGQVAFDCATLQPQSGSNINYVHGSSEEAMQYTVTVDQRYYQQSSTIRVSVNGGSLGYTSLYLQARAVGQGSIGGWSSPYPVGYSITGGCMGPADLDAIIKVTTELAFTAEFEWKPPFADTSNDIFFLATFVNGEKYYIMVSEQITDPCNPSPCSSNETCFRGTPSPGYFCADACIAVTCQYGGTCITQNGEAACICPKGLTGTTCESCDPNYCENGGICIIHDVDHFQCLCTAEYMGTRCQIPRVGTACDSNPCSNGGTCGLQDDGSYQCSCKSDFTGTRCEQPVSNTFCNTQGCLNGGTCTPIAGSTAGSCTCAVGFIGTRCEAPDPCFDYCLNGGVCSIVGNMATCQCTGGFQGTRCETSTGFCSLNLCQNGATCVLSGDTSGHCLCAAGFTGTACDQPISSDPCVSNPCQNGGTCQVSQGSPAGYSCQCQSQYLGINCERDPCTSAPCQNGGTCQVSQGSPAGYSCQCLSPYVGINCETDPCVPNPCFNGGSCFPTSGPAFSFCLCPSDYTGTFCQDVLTPCSSNPCLNGGTCLVSQGSPSSYTCQCSTSHVGTNCETVSPCVPSPCQNSGTCSVNQGSPTGYSCQCNNFFLGNNCETISPCVSNPCQNGGQCTPLNEGFSCVCQGFWTGDRCDIEDSCRSRQPCLNGGTCLATGHATYQCQCPSTFMGQNCQTVSPCSSSPCLNGGQCTSSNGGYTCSCLGFWTGDRCNIEDSCMRRQPCLNGGTCFVTGDATYQCQCPSSFRGENCEFPNPCANNPCLQGGTCRPSTDGSTFGSCDCPPGFTGVICQTAVASGDACSNSQCVNGTCIEDARESRNYRCECQEGFGGDFCNSVVDYCLAHKPCLNGGTCTNQGGSNYECNCMNPYFGVQNCLFSKDNRPIFQDCVETTHQFQLGPDKTAFVNLNVTAIVPETGQAIGFDVVVGPDSVSFPGVVTYTVDYLDGQKFLLRAMDQFNRESTCSFTIQLLDPFAPTIICPEDHEDISSRDRVDVASLPLPFIEASDNIGLPEENVFTYVPEQVNVDGRSRQVTVSVYDVAGNRAECQFGLTIFKGDDCGDITKDNGHVSCSLDSARRRSCEIRCNEGFLPPNEVLYTCINNEWNSVPLGCLETQVPLSFSKGIKLTFLGTMSLCDHEEFITNFINSLKTKLSELNLCDQGSSVTACGENSVSASCNEPDQNLRRKRQTTGSEVVVDLEVSGTSQDEVSRLTDSIDDAVNGEFVLVVGNQTLELVVHEVNPHFIVACQSGSISRQESCLLCPRGTYHDLSSNECLQCEIGTFQDEAGQLQCKECGTNTFQNQKGQTSCILCEVGSTSDDEATCPSPTSWVQIVIYACVGVGALLVIIIFILMVCLWQSTQEEKKQDQKRWELSHSTQLNKSYEPEEDMGFRPRVNTTVSATTYQTVPEGDGTPNLGNGVTNGGHELVRIPTEELYAGLAMDSHGRTVGVDSHPAPQPRRYQYENGYHSNHHNNGFMSYGHDRHNFPV